MSEIRILIVEDEPLIATDIEQCLDNLDFRVSGIAYDPTDALHELANNQPDVVLLDINLSSDQMDGIDLAQVVKEKYQIPVIFLTSYSDRPTLDKAKRTAPAGYILKPFDERTLLATLEISLYNFAQRQKYQQPPLLLEKINRKIPTPLTDREFEVLKQLHEGRTNQQMADELFVSVNTIKTHLNNLYLKLDANSRSMVIKRVREYL
ncbi:MAG: response regulator transcription factor [Spirosomataceae bacterium]